MLTKGTRSLALIFYALSMGLSFAHALEMPAKMHYDGPLYVTVQNSLYRLWGPPSPAAFVEPAALLSTSLFAFLTRKRRSSFLLALIALVCLVLAFPVIFFRFTEPANRAFRSSPSSNVPKQWRQLRVQWESSHTVRFGLELFGFLALTFSSLIERSDGRDAQD